MMRSEAEQPEGEPNGREPADDAQSGIRDRDCDFRTSDQEHPFVAER